MVLISSIFTGAKSLHDRFTLTSVEYPECSYYALMRFLSDSRYNWANLLKIIAVGYHEVDLRSSTLIISDQLHDNLHYWLIERCRPTEHRIHIFNIRNIPISYRFVERFCVFEHTGHIFNIRNIPKF